MTITIELDRNRSTGGYFLSFPNGDTSWQPSREFAEKKAAVWLREHRQEVNGDVVWS